MSRARLQSLRRPFTTQYLRYDELTAQLHAWADAFPELARVESIGGSADGRELWLLTVGGHAARRRPAVWVDGNMHASEVCGTAVSLQIAEDILALHLEPEAPLHGLPQHARDRLREVVFHILPRMSPDGAESVLTTGRYVRSNVRDTRPHRHHARWLLHDVDGDGLIFIMRKEDPAGDFVESSTVPGLMVPRSPWDAGPFYRLWPEGVVEPWDGFTVPDPHFLSDNDTDLNRNFPYVWAGEPEQEGAGAFPLSAPEARAVVEFASAHPEIFAWFNFHTFGGVHIRPLGGAADKAMDPSDLALFKQIGAWAEDITGYPMVSGFEEFLYKPDQPLRGAIADWAYHHRGCISYVTELWDLFRQMEIPRRKPFTEHYTHLTRDDMERIGKWDLAHNKARVLRPWVKKRHPQLGDVEVGGLDPRIGLWNPPLELLADVCRRHSELTLRVASLAPSVKVTRAHVERLDGELRRVTVDVENHGYLPTYVLGSSKNLPFNEPVHLSVQAVGCALGNPADAHQRIGHLDGWGRGVGNSGQAIYHQRSRGNGNARRVQMLVKGKGALELTFHSCRIGATHARIEVG